ncbi:YggS family pyridoxal phosphate-dependent enzyme [Muricauda sp. 2012CJ35-5]|uniref:Pyridoxal phosphate homeostasis protein n=1 Tax=Flagellimonas spongiicola TaxID=2942208 RepID=A0ABT0PRM4_9FLAO|nr:YggS family pyridoxal phosphate-dependent enzyme [Allomuricauda spongiicola]MCL6273103.1 YggS family pyridoxal phosphate-dependent enzyme [Allomuricauda spongiicola]
MIKENLANIKDALPEYVTLVAVSKTKPETDIMAAYEAGQRVFGENKIQEMAQKWEKLPKDIEWHMIGHVQRNKVKYMAEFVSLVHGVDSLRLLTEINKQAMKHNRIIPCLLQIHIAEESTKFGLNTSELNALLTSNEFKALENVRICGLMGMATFTENQTQIRKEFGNLKTIYDSVKKKIDSLSILSMGMSGDYQVAIEEGSTMVRIGSSIFGVRNYN